MGVRRQKDDPGTPLAPAPGLGQLTELTDAFTSTGLTVQVNTEGMCQPLTPGVDLTVSRIVQEALTNVTKHAAARAAHVHLHHGDDQLTVTVTDDGTSPSPRPLPRGTASG
ncbi:MULTISPECIES: ATP-binding protein [unclassified Streptomyces]|uniref:ATP-binding protein n=1 Tax=unclassified Streptomyces TaxID=2593676 RepID=UPI003864B083